MAGRMLEGVVQVVPALAKGEEGHQRVVAAVVGGAEGLAAEEVAEGIDRLNSVKQQGGTETEGPQIGQPTDLIRQQGQQQQRHEVEAVDGPQHGIRFHIGGQGLGQELARKQPASLGPKEPPETSVGLIRRMDVRRRIRTAVVGQVVGFPPARAHMTGTGTHEAPQAQQGWGGVVGAVRQQPVVDGRGGQHADQVKAQGPGHGPQTEASGQQQQATGVTEKDKNRTKPVAKQGQTRIGGH